MCLYPKLIVNPKYKKNKKNRGIIPPVFDERIRYVPIGCQSCVECRKQKARNWQVRLLEDLKEHKNGKFITLTFTNESYRDLAKGINKYEGYDLDNQIATLAVRKFLERWRKTHKKSLRHWLVTELGHNGTENIHLHGIIWTDVNLEIVQKHWGYGYMWKGNMKKGKLENYVNERTVNYIIKYITKIDNDHKLYKSCILTSAGIGSHYTKNLFGDSKRNTYNGTDTKEYYRTRSGHKIALPIYYRNKIYTDEEREKLWINKLDKNERWICGERVDIAKNDIEYYKLLEWYRRLNAKMGYGTGYEGWEREQYERERRILLQKARFENAKPEFIIDEELKKKFIDIENNKSVSHRDLPELIIKYNNSMYQPSVAFRWTPSRSAPR